ncbi:GGDEF domain-containing protein [Saccharopolyspora sp. SCSIO 74807]|uniref:GGDEF domain-containing protein n=1 Tax=Saccharopolyspora sp. SCSIO 74807 TaxID=3118084 RepID=UPI0030CBA697
MQWKATAMLATGTCSLAWVGICSYAFEAHKAREQRHLASLRIYIAELERQLTCVSKQAWDTVAEVPLRAAWESLVDARLTAEPERTAVVWVDLDQFKQVNDRHGHLAGDAVLRAVARRLEEAFAAREPVVTRLGGDEFGVLVRDLDEDTDLARFAALMEEPVALPHGRSVPVAASVGFAHARELPHETGRWELLRCADAASYAHKPHRSGEVGAAPTPRSRKGFAAAAVLGAAR